jgi:hypothetical protein
MKRSLLLLIAVCPALLGCNDCDRSGCDTFSKKASANISQGIAGAVSLESSQIADGCQICSLSEGALDVWPAPAAVHDAVAGCQLTGTPAPVSFTMLGHYQHELDPGEYLICVSGGKERPCIGVTVTAGKVTTLNVKFANGPSLVAVMDPGGSTFRSDAFPCASSGP